jgi:RNA polymerase sigma factor (sigma-70 family)
LQEQDLGLDAADFATPEKKVLIQERSQALAAAVRELDPQLQDVFICRFINKLSHAETARTLGLKEGHVRVLQYRALKKIRITLE